jgi:hypothetical protein
VFSAPVKPANANNLPREDETMTLHKEVPVGPHGIMEIIAAVTAQHASGRLDIAAGETFGALLFNGGKLVAARIGHLTGFQAINAVASMRDARFHFDPSVAVPAVSSITPSERLVLKQFFGIETAQATAHSAPIVGREMDEATLVTSSVPSEVIAEPTVETPVIHRSRPRVRYLAVAALVVLFVGIGAAAVLLREKFRERRAGAAVVIKTEPVTAPEATQPSANERPGATEQPRATEEPRVVNDDEQRATEEPRVSNTDEPHAAEEPRIARTDEPRAAEEPRSSSTSPAATPDLTGEWNVVNTVNTTSYKSFQNLRIGFAVSINQTGKTFTARGRKVSENGRSLPANSRTPIELHGVINGDRIEATFSEQGAARKTNGKLVWKIDRAGGGLTGTFASAAAKTSGKSTATREL